MHLNRPFSLVPAVGSLISVAVALALAGCQTTGPTYGATGVDSFGNRSGEAGRAAVQLYSRIPQDRVTTATRKFAAEGIKALDERDYAKASDAFNLAVSTDITN